jgi:hypothetical protein
VKPSTYWRTLLAASVLISTAGNTGHTLLVGGDHSWAAACWAAVPPLMIFAVTHGLASSAGAGVRLWVYRAGVTGAVLIAAGAFWASYVALRDLSRRISPPSLSRLPRPRPSLRRPRRPQMRRPWPAAMRQPCCILCRVMQVMQQPMR